MRTKLTPFLLVVTAVLLAASQAPPLASIKAVAQEGDERLAPTPIITVIQPGIANVVPQQTVVAPIQSTSEARTEEAGQGLAGEQSGGNLFTGVWGGLVGAGIAFGAVLALAVAVAAVRRGFNTVRQ